MRTSAEIGKLIKQLRKKNNVNLTDFATKIGVNKSTLSRYENGSRKIPMEDIAEIANALNVTPESLLLKNKQPETEVQHRAAHLEGELTDDEWQRVLDYADYIKSKRK
ncbi:helix-turn-helix domain-containing protein [Staphylococcus lugdunensis]|uniref:Helix-turn-helix transcriptional regulator n=1 Tax=Staphylococcus lugdunensis TaxID=28035 RepID=A0ABX6BTW4_STALU|nr:MULTISPECIES: helix-turn-helix transcriptional regulator [Staphylococcus]MCH8657702.1 helix-turn-helix domain-containing protein [Staphylococcus lugdunensis]MCH8668234.1 helix-turn-helix domain-containing protein [Staphylococcus lugdunensis]OHP78952.1 transcriptional regulator [Staphylococcus sp. HMSC063A07]OHQ42051.1 transcriptional regulator [Staphylococcus sp. HMSC069E09]QEX38310.1 helix-turn-helix transcriptional regulator [Staphylococcus lugdunensis]